MVAVTGAVRLSCCCLPGRWMAFWFFGAAWGSARSVSTSNRPPPCVGRRSTAFSGGGRIDPAQLEISDANKGMARHGLAGVAGAGVCPVRAWFVAVVFAGSLAPGFAGRRGRGCPAVSEEAGLGPRVAGGWRLEAGRQPVQATGFAGCTPPMEQGESVQAR